MQRTLNKFLVVFVLLFSTFSLMAQNPTDNSPYSRYGFGNLTGMDFPVLQAMGGISTAYHSSNNLNLSNPASLGFLNTTAFQVGIDSKYSNLKTNDASASAWSGNLTHMVLGFPLKNPINKVTETRKTGIDWGMAFGLVPFSRVGYDIETTSNLPNIGDVQYNYTGSGGQYQFVIANGVAYKGLSVGVQWGHLFGKTANQRIVQFDDLTDPFTDILTNELNLRGSIWNLGLQYEYIFGGRDVEVSSTSARAKQKTRLTLGLTASPASNVTVITRDIAIRQHSLYGLDTVSSSLDIEQTATMPSSFGFGVTLAKDLKWLVGVNFTSTKWDKYVNPAKTDPLGNSWRFGIGGEYTPDFQSYNRYFKRASYRFGFSTGTDPRIVGGEQLKETAVSFGIGLPVQVPQRGTVGYANLAFQVGQQGIPSLIQDTFFKISLGFSLNDNSWFYKQRYN